VPDWIWFLLAALVAVAVGTILAYALAAPGGHPRRRDPQSTGKTRYELDNAVVWNPWPILIAAAVVAALIALIVLVDRG
jgi:ABC-type antimicrobial peptide transport system permease subunit